MKNDYTHIEIVIDISGSMMGKEHDVVGGINSILEQQRENVRTNGGKVKVNIRRFDTSYETIREDVDVEKCPNLVASEVAARGGTALLDAVGKSIDKFGSYLSSLPESERPAGVIFVTYTDGEENSSREYKLEQIKAKVKEQEEKYSWQFFFLGEGIDGFEAGSGYGFKGSRSASFDSYRDAGTLLGSKIVAYSSSLTRGLCASEAAGVLDWEETERAFLKNEVQ